MRWWCAAQWGEAINAFRFQIVGGQLHVEPIGAGYRHAKSGQTLWFPANSAAPGALLATVPTVM